jgi:hypothetical protein
MILTFFSLKYDVKIRALKTTVIPTFVYLTLMQNPYLRCFQPVLGLKMVCVNH